MNIDENLFAQLLAAAHKKFSQWRIGQIQDSEDQASLYYFTDRFNYLILQAGNWLFLQMASDRPVKQVVYRLMNCQTSNSVFNRLLSERKLLYTDISFLDKRGLYSIVLKSGKGEDRVGFAQ